MSHKLENSRSPNHDGEGMLLPIPIISVPIVKVILHRLTRIMELLNKFLLFEFYPDELCGYELIFGHNYEIKLT